MNVSLPSISSILHFAWGMTLNLSHQDQQRYLAETFKARFVALWDLCGDEKNIAYLNDVAFILSAYERTYGFERDVYFTRLDNWDTLRQDKIDYYKDLANITSGNSDSVYSRALAFLGSGSIAGSVSDVSKFGTIHFDSTMIPFFLIGGAVGFGMFTMFIRWYAHKKIENTDENITTLINDFWNATLRPSFMRIYFELANDLMATHQKHFGSRSDGSLPEDAENLKKEISNMLPPPDAYLYIYDKNKKTKQKKS